jgi:hypothetical protein
LLDVGGILVDSVALCQCALILLQYYMFLLDFILQFLGIYPDVQGLHLFCDVLAVVEFLLVVSALLQLPLCVVQVIKIFELFVYQADQGFVVLFDGLLQLGEFLVQFDDEGVIVLVVYLVAFAAVIGE